MSNFISAEKLGHQFHDRWLFKDLNFGINAGQRIAIVGVNGAGKSTLMNIIAGELDPSEGKMIRNKSIRIGHLAQDPVPTLTCSISDYIFSDEHPALSLIKRYEEVLENPEGREDEINQLTDELSAADAWEYEHKIKQILGILGVHHLKQAINRHHIEVMKGNYKDGNELLGHVVSYACNSMMLWEQLNKS